ncbi:hypothetical protein D3C84_814670 [compost metagenome]
MACAPGQEPIACGSDVQCPGVVVAFASMAQFGQVASGIVFIVLGKVEQLPGVDGCLAECRNAQSRRFAARRADQLVEAVVGECADGFGPLVMAEPNRLGPVLDSRHVAHRVVAVVQVLQGAARDRCTE